MDAALVTIDLCNIRKQIKEEQAWKDSDRNALTVFKTDGLQIVLIELHKDAEMKKSYCRRNHKRTGTGSTNTIYDK